MQSVEETLGSGHFAVVKLARHVFTGEKVAVKVIDKTKLDEVSRAHLFQEVRCMKLVQHPNVVRLYEVIDTQTKLYLILELGDGGDLYDYIMKHEGGLSENLAREYFRQIVRAISYCHQLHVVHRDLKPENVVFFEKLGVVKLTDFGFSNKFCPGQKLETSCGSLAYSAPEILLGDSYDAPAVDVWSLGVILYMLVCGTPPFEKANDSETLTMIMDCKYTMPSHVSVGCRDLIAAMLVREPEKRATLQAIAQNSWLTQGAQDTVPEYLPLVSRQQVSDEDHTLIIQKMVNGNIATKEEILDALDRNEYNHITATYFLLAERKLRQQRQDQIQKRRPELSLPVSSTSRLSPRTRTAANSTDRESSGDSRNHLLVPSNNQLTPRTPGAESTAGGRSRKCSIVQEEDDEDEIPSSNRDELQTPLNRRGSRSEGRINLAIQDRVPEAERLKKESTNAPTNSSSTKANLETGTNVEYLSGATGGLKPINKDLINMRNRLGGVSGGISRKLVENNRYHQNIETEQHHRADVTQTKFLVDSSTITIPISSATSQTSSCTNAIPKYKTMPSPTRPNAILTGGARALNEIFEEGTDIGSSDSATTTPRPVVRSSHFTSNRANQSNPTTQRRSKFHKSRTPSCSSSDASDDDSESRKKRVHKINVNDVSKPLQSQRRDSHDDSSDSQDQGTAAASGGNGSSSGMYLLPAATTTTTGDRTGSTTTHTTNQNSNCATHGRQKTDQPPIVFRRHRAGRRRAGETRLRESQSLNRITEVQESELPPVSNSTSSQLHSSNNNNNNMSNNSHSAMNSSMPASMMQAATHVNCHQKPKGISARLFHGFIKKADVIQTPLHDSTSTVTISPDPGSNDEVDMVLGMDFTKNSLRVNESKSSSATKKLKMLGRYFQRNRRELCDYLCKVLQEVHKKICIPLPGLFQRGRLYKAQSCGSIVRDKVNHNIHSNAPPNTTRHSVLFTEKGKILRNCLGSRFLGNSDSDINQNNGKTATQNQLPQASLLFTIPSSQQTLAPTQLAMSQSKSSVAANTVLSNTNTTATTFINSSATAPAQNCNLPNKKSTSPLHQLSDVPLCSSKC
ncbi:unnamed protein product [Hermetia illucens]|uniref:SNF-related serine/threonine-protein kinase n=1 Tax=Hermetia illucens TaxID=343691 RepID=A0A7R8YX05_HERIL|nr:unnamed protein product [Hermetia illucens]